MFLHVSSEQALYNFSPLCIPFILSSLSPAVGVRCRAVVWGLQGAGLLQQPAVQLLWPARGVQPHQAPAQLSGVLPAGGPDGSTQGKRNNRAHETDKQKVMVCLDSVAAWCKDQKNLVRIENPIISEVGWSMWSEKNEGKDSYCFYYITRTW